MEGVVRHAEHCLAAGRGDRRDRFSLSAQRAGPQKPSGSTRPMMPGRLAGSGFPVPPALCGGDFATPLAVVGDCAGAIIGRQLSIERLRAALARRNRLGERLRLARPGLGAPVVEALQRVDGKDGDAFLRARRRSFFKNSAARGAVERWPLQRYRCGFRRYEAPACGPMQRTRPVRVAAPPCDWSAKRSAPLSAGTRSTSQRAASLRGPILTEMK